MTTICDWIEPGTTVIGESWAAYRYVGAQGYTHHTVKHSNQFVNPHNVAHTITIESTWRNVKLLLGKYNRVENYEFHLAHYMFAARCNIPPYMQLLHLVAITDWSLCLFPRSTKRAT